MSRKSKRKSRVARSPSTPAAPAPVLPAPLSTAVAPAPALPHPAAAPRAWNLTSLLQRDWIVALLFFLGILLAYSHVLTGDFVWDDDSYISQNPAMRTLHGLWQMWFDPRDSTHQYYPLSNTFFWIEWQLWGMRTLGYHVVNVCLHTTVTFLLWQILKRLRVKGALFAAALFAFHPINVMSVAWMNELKNTLSCSLALCSAWAWLRFEGLGIYESCERGENAPERDVNAPRPWKWYAAALALFLCAMMAKTAVSFLPVSLLLLLWWQRKRLEWRAIWPLLPMIGIVAGLGLFTIHIEHVTSGATGEEFKVSFPGKLVVSGHSFFFYIGKILLPLKLSFIYERWEINPHDWRQYLWPLALVAFLALLWLLREKIGKAPFAAAVHFYISTSFLVLMVVLFRMRYSYVADHWVYFGSMSLFALLGSGLTRAWVFLAGARALPGKILACSLVAVLAAATWVHCTIFANYETLWRRTVAANPECWMAENNLGNLLTNTNRVQEGMTHLQKAMAIKSDYALAMTNYGNALMELALGASDKAAKNRLITIAIAYYEKSDSIKPNNPDTLNDIGFARLKAGHLQAAIDYFQRALKLKPSYTLARNNMAEAVLEAGNDLQAHGRIAEAIKLYRKSIAIVPDSIPALNNLAYLLATSRDDTLRDGALAAEFAQKANQLTDEKGAVLLDTLAAAYAEQGRYKEAIDTEQKAIARAAELKDLPHEGAFKKHLELYQDGQPLRDN